MNTTTKKYISIAVGLATIASLALAMTVSADTITPVTSAAPTTQSSGYHKGHGQRPAVEGIVSAISGNSITVTSKGFGSNATATTYTVDATNATVTKNNVASTVSGIAVGDTVMVQGTVTGTSVTATSINDGQMGKGGMFGRGGMQGHMPGVFGTVSAVNGNSITVASKGFGKTPTSTTYTVDATNAKITKNNAAGTISSIAVGDTIMVQGTVSGTSVTATAIHDGIIQRTPRTSGSTGVHTKNGIFGTVASINGTILTVTGKVGSNGGTATTYTVDASSATVTKSGAAASVFSISVGDTVTVRGTITGTNVTATAIRDGVMAHVRPVSTSVAN